MAARVKLYRKTYRDSLLLREDLQHLIELFQTYCTAPTILINGMRIEHPNDLNFLTQPLASEIIATGRTLYPTMVDPTTDIGPSLQLRITRSKVRFFVNADAKSDFQELINQISALFSRNTLSVTKRLIGGIQGGLISGIAGVEFPNIGHLGTYTSNYLLFWIFNALWTSFSVGLAVWLWATLTEKVAPRFVLSLDDAHAHKIWKWRNRLSIAELVLSVASMVGIFALINAFWVQLGFH